MSHIETTEEQRKAACKFNRCTITDKTMPCPMFGCRQLAELLAIRDAKSVKPWREALDHFAAHYRGFVDCPDGTEAWSELLDKYDELIASSSTVPPAPGCPHCGGVHPTMSADTCFVTPLNDPRRRGA